MDTRLSSVNGAEEAASAFVVGLGPVEDAL
jgi:hypothetical protein